MDIPGGFQVSYGHFWVISGEYWSFPRDFRGVLVVSGQFPMAMSRVMLGHGLRQGSSHGQRYKAISRLFWGDFRQVLAVPG